MTLADYLRVLRVRARVWLVCLVLGIGLAGLYNYLAPVRYTATATAFVLVNSSDPSSPDNFQNSQFAVQRVKSYAPLIDSPDVIGPVIGDLQLDVTPRELREMVSVSSPPETVLMEIAVTDGDAERAALIANNVAAELGQLIEEIETPAEGVLPNVKVTLTRPAETPTAPSSPRTVLNLLLGLVAGLAVGFVAALARHALDRRIKAPADVRAVTGVAPLGATLRNRTARRDPLVVLDNHSAGAERYRTVRSALKFAMVDSALRHVVISSPDAGDGKTTMACNLALSWAQSGARVCLVEADLRRPGAASMMGLDGTVGLSEVLVGDVPLDDALIPWQGEQLTVLPAGSLPPDPAALLGSESMASLVATLRDRFDIVIYDTAPLGLVADAVVLGSVVDGVVLVVSSGVTTRDRLAACVETLDSARVPLLGTVLGSVRISSREVQHYAAVEQAHRRSAVAAPRRGRSARPAADDSALTGDAAVIDDDAAVDDDAATNGDDGAVNGKDVLTKDLGRAGDGAAGSNGTAVGNARRGQTSSGTPDEPPPAAGRPKR